MLKIIITSFLLINSFFIFSQERPDACDVVLVGKNTGYISKELLIKSKKITFYNSFCQDSIIGYRLTINVNSRSVYIDQKSNLITKEILKLFSKLDKNESVTFSVDVYSGNSLFKKSIILKIK